MALTDAGLAVHEVSDVTGFPEMMDGRVKTLHPAVHGGLLAIRDNPGACRGDAGASHPADRSRWWSISIRSRKPSARGAGFDDCIENIDIGGPAMIRAAAKNHGDVAVVVEPSDYDLVLDEFARHGGMTTLALRRQLPPRPIARTAAYDAAIANWFAAELGEYGARFPFRRRPADRRIALWREPASVGGFLSYPRGALRRRDRAAGAGQATFLQQHQRHRRGL